MVKVVGVNMAARFFVEYVGIPTCTESPYGLVNFGNGGDRMGGLFEGGNWANDMLPLLSVRMMGIRPVGSV